MPGLFDNSITDQGLGFLLPLVFCSQLTKKVKLEVHLLAVVQGINKITKWNCHDLIVTSVSMALGMINKLSFKTQFAYVYSL